MRNASESVSLQQRDQLEAQAVRRFGVGEFAGLVVESSRPDCRSEPSKTRKIAPFQMAGPDEVRRSFGAIKAQVRALVSGPACPSQEPKQPVLASPAEQRPTSKWGCYWVAIREHKGEEETGPGKW
ncbi:hypothetical protein Q3A66_19060 [Hymenobacter sp. BT770]|uniref:hypothetical protein n=1 Tax=Hymenobacter sp. BT770 TaxID=2886942 RepID=UPI001D0F83AF|nr:hypothetical protein [Hymenobacter sp. BT770]MCC3155218.1 hypothetical protein [Hymenobacter sp. BT770]MDO3417173.1 hypothetical protein [Hymenobacter sp. BT770]